MPGDPAVTILGNQATPARVALLQHQWGLDRPLPVQYGKFMGRVVHGDLGTSLFYDVAAGHLVLRAAARDAVADRASARSCRC